MNATIIHLPNSRFTLEVDGKRASNTAHYDQRALFLIDDRTYVAQTGYWGTAACFLITKEINCDEIDNTVA